MASKLDTFLSDQGIDPRRVLTASRQEERLTRTDRQIRAARARAGAKAKGDDKPKAAEAPVEGAPQPSGRTGRSLTERALRAARAGAKLPGPIKSRIVRAVNRILAQRGKDTVDVRALF